MESPITASLLRVLLRLEKAGEQLTAADEYIRQLNRQLTEQEHTRIAEAIQAWAPEEVRREIENAVKIFPPDLFDATGTAVVDQWLARLHRLLIALKAAVPGQYLFGPLLSEPQVWRSRLLDLDQFIDELDSVYVVAREVTGRTADGKPDKSDTASDIPKKPAKPKRKQRPMNEDASTCAAAYRRARVTKPKLKLKPFLEEHCEDKAFSAESIYRILNDNPNQWRESDKAATSRSQ